MTVGVKLSSPVQTGPGAHPDTYTMGTGLTIQHNISPTLKKEKSYTFISPSGIHDMLYNEIVLMSLPEFETRTSQCAVVAARGKFLSMIILKCILNDCSL